MSNYTIEIQNRNSQKEQYNIKFIESNKEKFSDNIWFTRKARIQSEKRLKRNHTHSQLLLIEYTLLGSILSVILLRYNNLLGTDTDILMTVFSIMILVISLIITNFDFKERSNSFKTNYIQLQELYLDAKEYEKNNQSLEETRSQYNKALESSENHELIDDICARVENAKDLTSRNPTIFEYSKCYGYKAIVFSVLFALYSMPFITILTMFNIK